MAAPSSHPTRAADSLTSESQAYLVAAPTDITLAPPVGPRGLAQTPAPLDDATDSDRVPLMPPSGGSFRLISVPGYELLGELGRGGMGVVYRAKQLRLNRLVALKMLLHHDLADPSDVARFRSEAEAVAAVRHPNVVQVYEFGQANGRPYFTMEFLPGGSLHARLKASAPFLPSGAATLVEKLARAVHAAHAQGIVHRDIKPGNVLFDATGEPRVTDFGLAKRLSSDLTQTRAVMGTPAYMAPEQASGRAKFAGPPADIYALGVILYECLTGNTPFRDEDSIRLINMVIQDAPPSIRSIAPAVPRDLELICLKCLEKEPGDRYATAAALADDLRHFAAGAPVSVRPPGVLERVVKGARRRPTVALAYGLGLLVAVLVLFGGTVLALWFRADAARAVADDHFRDAETARQAAVLQELAVKAANDKLAAQNHELEAARDTLTKSNAEVSSARDELARQKKEVENARDELDARNMMVQLALDREKAALDGEKTARVDLERLSYFRDVGFAYKEFQAGNYLRAIQLLDACPDAARKWEWWYVYRAAHTEFGSGVAHGSLGWPADVAFLGDTKNVTTTHPVAASVVRFDFERGGGMPSKFHPERWLCGAVLSDDGSRILTIRPWEREKDDGIEVWDYGVGVRLAKWKSPGKPCSLAMLSGDGKRVVVGYRGEPIRAFDVETGAALGELHGIALPMFAFGRMSRDGTVAAVIDGKGVVVWNVTTGKEIRRLPPADAAPTYVAVSPGNNLVAIGDTDGGVWLYDVAKKATVIGDASHGGMVSAIAFSRDGKTVATAGEDGVVRLWDAATGKMFKDCHGHTRKVCAVRFDATGTLVASTDMGGAFRVWDVHEYFGPRNEARTMDGTVAPFFLSADLTQLFAASNAMRGALSRYNEGQAYPFGLPPGGLGAAGFQPGSARLILGGVEGHLFAFDKVPAAGTPFGTVEGRVDAITFTPDGKFFLVRAGRRVSLWDAELKPVFSAEGASDDTVAAVSPDGKSVAIAFGKHLRLWDVATKKQAEFYVSHDLSAVGFTPTGDRLVVGTRDWKLEVWDRTPGERGKPKVTATFEGHTAAVVGFGYSGDGRRLATGAADGTVKVWDVETKQEALALTTGHRKPVSRVWWGPDEALATIPDGCKPVLFNGQKRDRAFRSDGR